MLAEVWPNYQCSATTVYSPASQFGTLQLFLIAHIVSSVKVFLKGRTYSVQRGQNLYVLWLTSYDVTTHCEQQVT